MFEQREITYSTGETEKLTGASQKQIIYWEKKGFIPKVERNICGDIAYTTDTDQGPNRSGHRIYPTRFKP